MKIIDVECSRLNKLYLEKNAEDFVRSFADLLDSGKLRKKAEYLQTAKSPGLKAQIMVGTEGTCSLISCAYEKDCGYVYDKKKGVICDFIKTSKDLYS